MKNILLTVIILIASILNVSANETDLKIQNLENKISNLEKQLDSYNDLHTDYKDIVYWVIGLWFSLFGWILFLNWFQSFKLWKKEIQNIKDEIINENKIEIENIKILVNKNITSKITSSLNEIQDNIHDIEHNVFINNKIKFIYEFKDKLENDLKINEYKIADTLEKLEDFLNNKELRVDEKIELKDILENFIPKMEKRNSIVLESDIITCKTIIKEKLWELD